MTTIAVVRRFGKAVIAADSAISFGDVALPYGPRSPRKIIKSGAAYVGICGDLAHLCAIGAALRKAPLARFRDAAELHTAWTRLHERLERHHHLQAANPEEPYASTHVAALVASPAGIFSVYPMREVIEHDDYWCAGSGAPFALGALAEMFERSPRLDCLSMAGRALSAAARFDTATREPWFVQVVDLARVGK